ncbi:hypothetical protein GCM10025857_22070 [Alicyclobacillus contaminans]|uniref:YcnI family copper-binding membrane protein n=1 Tax=Alicyclobacillus contaminans TaxID=392016 RepID=UPI0006867842|nr:DUF1775 domain-containing protein [Alicyclobacillus contaminans]GMA50850.1 hypothetical protein GCM10025857_22070 [Alicyclobacillus contaminans]
MKGKHTLAMFGTAAAVMIGFAPMASAHVTVWPKQSTVGAWEKYTVRVPTEKEIPTVKVVLKMPKGITFEQYEAVPGWTVAEQKDSQGQVISVTWTAIAGGIAPGQFAEFSFIAANPKTPEAAAWDAFQYYKDGSIVEWTGAPSSQTPHSITQILSSTSGSDSNSAAPTTNATGASTATNTSPSTTSGGNSRTALALSIVALVVALVSLARSVWRKR